MEVNCNIFDQAILVSLPVRRYVPLSYPHPYRITVKAAVGTLTRTRTRTCTCIHGTRNPLILCAPVPTEPLPSVELGRRLVVVVGGGGGVGQ